MKEGGGQKLEVNVYLHVVVIHRYMSCGRGCRCERGTRCPFWCIALLTKEVIVT